MATQNIVNYYAVVFSLRPPDLLRPGRVLQRQNACKNQEKGVCPGVPAIVNHSAIVNSLQIVNLLPVVFLVRPGPLGSGTGDSQHDSRESIRANHSQLKHQFL